MQKLFNKIVVPIDFSLMSYMMDTTYMTALYKLYQYYYYRDVAKADKFLKAYLRNADPSPKHAYMLTDLYYVLGKFQ